MTEPYGYDENDTDDSYDDDSSDNEGGYGRIPRSKIKAWEKTEKQAKRDAEELATLRRELALTKAGVGTLTERQQKALLASIDGDITAENVRTAAEELGFVQPQADSPQDEEAAALNRMSQASAGAADPGSEDSIAKLERAAREGGKDALLAQIQADGHLVVPAS